MPAYGIILIPVLLVTSHITKYSLREGESVHALSSLKQTIRSERLYCDRSELKTNGWLCSDEIDFIVFLTGSQSPVLWTIWAEVIWKHWVWMATVLDVLYPRWGLQWQCIPGNMPGKEIFSRTFLVCLRLSVNGCADPVTKWKSSLIGKRQSLLESSGD